MWETLQELFSYFSARKRIWLLPVVAFLVLLGVLIVVGSQSAFAPFIYTLF